MSEHSDAKPFWDLERYRGEPGGRRRDDTGWTPPPPPPPPSRSRPPDDGGPPEAGAIALGYESDPARLFWTALRASLLTIATLGLYRFWMLTRLRRLYWGSVRIDGDPLEYTGSPVEKLLGFLLALVVLALYLGLVNLGLTWLGLAIAGDDPWMLQAALQLSVLATLPLIFYATYRGQRYVLARTRWRGIRFGLGPGAWGYAWRGMVLSVLTVLTLGLGYPYQHFHMTKYMTDRAWFGDQPFVQGGSWTELFAQWVPVYLVVAVSGLLIWWMVANPEDTAAAFVGGLVVSLGVLAVIAMVARYRVAALRALWSGRSLGEARFESSVSPPRVLFLYVAGGIGVGVVTALIALVLAAGGWAAAGAAGLVPDQATLSAAMEAGDRAALSSMTPLIVAGVVLYLVVMASANALSQVFITSPVLSAMTRATVLHNAGALAGSRQRDHDAAAEAGGFADALGVDVGAGV